MAKSRFYKKCILCGEEYEYCGNCSRFRNYPRWMETVHNLNCKTIVDTVMNYKAGVKTPAECKADLEGCDLSYRNQFNDGMNAIITAILATGKKTEYPQKVDIEESPVEKEPEKDAPNKEKSITESFEANEIKVDKKQSISQRSEKTQKTYPKKTQHNFQKKEQ